MPGHRATLWTTTEMRRAGAAAPVRAAISPCPGALPAERVGHDNRAPAGRSHHDAHGLAGTLPAGVGGGGLLGRINGARVLGLAGAAADDAGPGNVVGDELVAADHLAAPGDGAEHGDVEPWRPRLLDGLSALWHRGVVLVPGRRAAEVPGGRGAERHLVVPGGRPQREGEARGRPARGDVDTVRRVVAELEVGAWPVQGGVAPERVVADVQAVVAPLQHRQPGDERRVEHRRPRLADAAAEPVDQLAVHDHVRGPVALARGALAGRGVHGEDVTWQHQLAVHRRGDQPDVVDPWDVAGTEGRREARYAFLDAQRLGLGGGERRLAAGDRQRDVAVAAA